MNIRRWLIAGYALAMLAGLLVSTSAPSSLAGVSVSEHYRLIASEVGNVPVAMQAESYMLNEGVAIQAEVAPPMESEHYRVSGIVPYKVYLPLVLKASW